MEFEYIENKILEWHKALNTLKEALDIENPNELEMDGIIQRFEYCFELAWKVLKIVIQDQNRTDVFSPKQAFQKAFILRLITDEEVWEDILKKRNFSVHTYNKELAQIVLKNMPNYYDAMFNTLTNIKNLYDLK